MKETNMITLQVPEGDRCDGCMFLRIHHVHFNPNRAECVLFKCDLIALHEYGYINRDTIKKCNECPTAQREP